MAGREPITTKGLMSGVIALNIVQVLYIFPLENPALYAIVRWIHQNAGIPI